MEQQAVAPKPALVEDDEKVKPAVEHGSEEAKKIRQLSDYVHTCRVCYQDYTVGRNRPRLLGCGHTFCTRCIIKCASQKNAGENGIKCPECRKNFSQPPASLPVNIQLMQILTVLSLVKLNVAPEEEEDLPSIHFGSLGNIVPANKLAELSMEDLHEHLKVVFNAVRLKAMAEKPANNRSAEQEISKIGDLEERTEKFMNSWERIKKGEDPMRWISPRHPQARWAARYPMLDLDNDWMREMVVFRPPGDAPLQPEIPPQVIPPTPPTVQAVIEQEQIAQAEADPARHVANYRQAHLRRERENARLRSFQDDLNEAFEEQRAMMNAPFPLHPMMVMNEEERRETEINRQLQLHYALETNVARELEERDREDLERLEQEQQSEQEAESGRAENGGTEYGTIDIHDDSISVMSDDSSIIEEEIRPAQRRLMTRGEGVTVMRLLQIVLTRRAANRWIPFGLATVREVERHLMPIDADRTDPLDPEFIREVRRYCLTNDLDMDAILKMLRTHTQSYAPTLVESPRLTRRVRRQRPVPSDDFNALLSNIRRRLKSALRGSTPTQPANDMETLMTMRLIVNVATTMGVCDKLETFLHPNHQNQNQNNNNNGEEEGTSLGEPVSNSPLDRDFLIEETRGRDGRRRRANAFCVVCRCSVPMESRNQHACGRRHLSNVNRQQQSRSTNIQTPSSSSAIDST